MKKIILFLVASFSLFACSAENNVGKGKDAKRVYIVQNGTKDGMLNQKMSLGQDFNSAIGFHCSGIEASDEDIRISVEIDSDGFDKLNAKRKKAGGGEYQKLPEGILSIEDTLVIAKGKIQSSLPFSIKVEKLQANTTYLLVLAIKSATGIEVDANRKSLAITFSMESDPTIGRTNTYEAFPNPRATAATLKTSAYSQYDNPTGIYFAQGDSIVVYAENIEQDDVFLKVNAWGKDWIEDKYPLVNGVNKFLAKNAGNSYLEYYSPNYNASPPIKLDFKTGKVNGVFDKNKHNDSDWKNMLANASSIVLDIVGNRVQLIYPVKELKEYCPDNGLRLVNLYDSIIGIQHQIMGLDKYNKVPKNKMLGRVIWQGFMHADGIGAAFHAGTMEHVADPYTIVNNCWGIAHEFGHVNQVRPDMKWVGTTEVTNNIYSIWTQYVLNPSQPKFEREVNSSYDDKAIICGRYNSYFESAYIHNQPWLTQAGPDEWKRWHDEAKPPYWHGDHFVKLLPLWQLQLYFSVLAEGQSWHQPDFYADVFNLSIENTVKYSDGEHQLNFMRRMCDITKTDLTDFFEKARMLIEIDEFIGDYTSAQLTITAQQVADIKQHASQYEKPKVPALSYVSANSIKAVQGKLAVKGSLNKGVVKQDNKIKVDHQQWINALAFETYENEKLIKVSIVGTGSPTNSETLVAFPANATHVEAIAWDGKRTLVYQHNQ